jgi:NIMA (never in mitosis gene a)-related kinase
MAMKANVPPKGRTLVELAQARAGGRPVDGSGNHPSSDDGSPKGKRFADRMAQREREAPTWDPERDEMPSPFLVRQRQPARGR